MAFWWFGPLTWRTRRGGRVTVGGLFLTLPALGAYSLTASWPPPPPVPVPRDADAGANAGAGSFTGAGAVPDADAHADAHADANVDADAVVSPAYQLGEGGRGGGAGRPV